jgi:hypothetical protein
VQSDNIVNNKGNQIALISSSFGECLHRVPPPGADGFNGRLVRPAVKLLDELLFKDKVVDQPGFSHEKGHREQCFTTDGFQLGERVVIGTGNIL